jgi:hypothetical protein
MENDGGVRGETGRRIIKSTIRKGKRKGKKRERTEGRGEERDGSPYLTCRRRAE